MEARQDLAWPAGYGRRIFARVDSTMAEAARLARDVAGPEWVLAHEQTAARGRRGRVWSNPKGNFAATLILPLTASPGEAALRSFVMALALYDAFSAVTGRVDGLALKWPNDVLLNGGKVAGILLESHQIAPDRLALALGVGVNLAHAPGRDAVEEGALPPVSLVSETGVQIGPESFLTALAQAFARHEIQCATFGFAPIREAWLARAARLGEVIRARTTHDETVGTFRDVDIDGQLVLETAKGRVRIAAADVYF